MITIMVALLCSIAALTVLLLATSSAHRARVYRLRTRAQLAAEGGIVWAQQQLWREDTLVFPQGNVDLTLDDFNVDVIVPACSGPPPCRRSIQAQVFY